MQPSISADNLGCWVVQTQMTVSFLPGAWQLWGYPTRRYMATCSSKEWLKQYDIYSSYIARSCLGRLLRVSTEAHRSESSQNSPKEAPVLIIMRELLNFQTLCPYSRHERDKKRARRTCWLFNEKNMIYPRRLLLSFHWPEHDHGAIPRSKEI